MGGSLSPNSHSLSRMFDQDLVNLLILIIKQICLIMLNEEYVKIIGCLVTETLFLGLHGSFR